MTDWNALADAVRHRRQELSLSRRAVYSAGGPSLATLAKIENPTADTAPPTPISLGRLDSGLRWPAGTAQAVLSGRLPPDDAAAKATSEFPDPDNPADDPLSPWSFILTLSQEVINYILDTYERPGTTPELHQRGESLVTDISDHYTTLLLEVYGGPDQETPPLLQAVIAGSLSAPEPPVGTAEHERWLYRRWLVGMPVDNQSSRRFAQHWKRRSESMRR
jgi:hypothetical protein